MPAALIQLGRQIVMMLVQTGAFVIVQNFVHMLIDRARAKAQEEYGLSEEDSETYVSNAVIDAVLNAGITLIMLRTKLPAKTADKLGFSTKGWRKRGLSKEGQAKIEAKTKGVKIPTTIAVTEAMEETAIAVSKSRGISLSSVNNVMNIIVKVVGVPTGLFFMIAQYIDFANWQGPYQSTFQKLLAVFGLEADKNASQPRALSKEMFDKLYVTLQSVDVVSIRDPYKNELVPLTRENLVNIADKLAGQINFEKGQTKFKDILVAITALCTFKNGSTTQVTTQTQTYTTPQTQVQQIKVFSGVVSQGVLSNAPQFIPRENDLIENMEELEQTAKNNLAPFITSLSSRITYEIKIVNTATSRDGFKQYGQTQQIVSGYTSKGEPKYKTVTNKFAVMDIYILNEKNTRVKLVTINLGPTDAVKFQPNVNDLINATSNIKSTITTSNINDISGINTINPITVTTPTQNNTIQPITPITPINDVKIPDYQDTGYKFYRFYVNGRAEYEVLPWLGNVPFDHEMITQEEYRKATGDMTEYNLSGYTIIKGIPYKIDQLKQDVINEQLVKEGKMKKVELQGGGIGYIPTDNFASNGSGVSPCKADTLQEFYTYKGSIMPAIQERSQIYQSLGLGNASLYIGTVEQNAKLLNALKAQYGCQI